MAVALLGIKETAPGERRVALTPETALTVARAAMEACRTQGYQVGVAVVELRDCGGHARPHAVVDLLGRATAKIHCSTDEDSDHDLVPFRTETAILAVTGRDGRYRLPDSAQPIVFVIKPAGRGADQHDLAAHGAAGRRRRQRMGRLAGR